MTKILSILRSLHKRSEFSLLTMILALLTTNCVTTKPLPAELQRFDLAKEVSSSELDGIYDISRLKVGDGVRLRGKIINSYEIKPKSYLTDKKLVAIDPSTQNYIVDILTVYQNGDALLRTIEAEPFHIRRISISGGSKTLNESKIESDQLDPIARAALTNLASGTGIVGFTLTVLPELIKKHRSEVVAKRYSQASKEHEDHHKIIRFDQISNEELTVGARRIFCKVYQIDVITKGITVSSGRSEPFYTVIDESTKVWVSDDVPFGIVKLDSKSIYHLGAEEMGVKKKPMEMTINVELIDFKD
jgi:hypothetical protein